MDWFLYDRDLRHDRVKLTSQFETDQLIQSLNFNHLLFCVKSQFLAVSLVLAKPQKIMEHR